MIRIGTRKSRLAMIQTEIVKQKILRKFQNLEIEIVPISTQGDKELNRSLTSFGGKGVFTKELEEALLNGTIDMAVHSAKDMPMELPAGLCLGAVLERADARDVLVTTSGIPARDLPKGSVIGTSSLRREIQIKEQNPNVQVKLLRGNVQTRLQKLKQGEYDGILLAAAGLMRLKLNEERGFFFEYLNLEEFVPAAGQGILAVETRSGDLEEIRKAIHSEETAEILAAEREFLSILGGSCNAPCGVYCQKQNQELLMTVMYARDKKHPFYCRQDTKGMNVSKDRGTWLAAKTAAYIRKRKVSLVGAGPGDAGLLTRTGLECVQKADVIIYDNLISPSILNEAKLEARLIYAGKRFSNHHLNQEEINRMLVEEAMNGNYVVRLKGGDPFIFGRGGEEARALSDMGIPFEIVPGVSSAYSVPAYEGIPVTQRNMASSFHVITGHEGSHKQEMSLDYATLAKEEGTLVFLMGLHNLERITNRLMQHGKDGETPAAVIQQGTTGRQRSVVGNLKTIVEKVSEAGISTPAVTVVGDVVSMKHWLQWFGQSPLSGIRVLLTGTRQMVKQLKEELEPFGAEAISLSLIETVPCMEPEYETQLQSVERYQWVVFTSTNGVELFFEALSRLQVDYRKLSKVKFAAVGDATAKSLLKHGFHCDFLPDTYTGEALADQWSSLLDQDSQVMLIRARGGNDILARTLTQKHIPYVDMLLYETRVDKRRKEELNQVLSDVDYVVVSSASAVQALAEMLDDDTGKRWKDKNIEARLVSIGPVTTEMAKKSGFSVYQTAQVHTAEGIAKLILDSQTGTDK